MGTENNKVDISVVIITYNHVKTIRKTLDSVLSQEISATYEILIVDDASNDGTKEVIAEYAHKYPKIIRPFVRKYNDCYPTKSIYYVLKNKARGRYIVPLEGDDYWIDTKKLSEQYMFLEHNNKFSAVTTDVRCEDWEGNELLDINLYKKKENNIFSLEDYKELSSPGRVATIFYRNPFFHKIDFRILYQADYMMGDMAVYAVLLTMGDIYQMDKKTAVYRFSSQEGGVNFNSLRLGNKFMDLRFLRYFIRIENYIRKYADDTYRINSIDFCIREFAGKYRWNDLYNAVNESKDKKRVLFAAMYHFLATDERFYGGTIYSGDDYSKKWSDFINNKKPVVLFGAGKMAEVFLDKYSFKKKVRFIVDNDTTKIGKSYKGYIVKRPDELLHFRNRVVVLITNENHEKDIANQLIQMGITDYYCFCSMRAMGIKNRILRAISLLDGG